MRSEIRKRIKNFVFFLICGNKAEKYVNEISDDVCLPLISVLMRMVVCLVYCAHALHDCMFLKRATNKE